MKKRFFAIFLSMAMLLSFMPSAAFAEYDVSPVSDEQTASPPETPEEEEEPEEPLEEGTLDIAKGVILITDTGYAQGKLRFKSGEGFYIEDGGSAKVEETLWGEGSHELTIISSAEESVQSTIVIAGGNPNITLNNVNITGSSSRDGINTIPAIALLSGTEENKATATLTLVGENKLVGATNAPGVEIDKYAELTIEGNGHLTAEGTTSRPGIGINESDTALHFNPTTKQGDKSLKTGGELVIDGGTIECLSQSGRAFGTSNSNDFGSITINDGEIIAKYNNNGDGIRAENVIINGGLVQLIAKNSGQGTNGIYATKSFAMSAGTLTLEKLRGGYAGIYGAADANFSITGGNANGYYTGEIEGRTLTKLYFDDGDGTPMKGAEVTVTEGEHSWTAKTNDDGMIITYLKDETMSISAAVGSEEAKEVPVVNGTAVIGIECNCENVHGTLTMHTASQSVMTEDGQAKVSLDAEYTDSDCLAPDGFHGNYNAISYEIVSVVKNGKPLKESDYAAIDGNTLTVYGDPDEDEYAVKVRAVSGPEDNKVYSNPITITVNTYESAAEEGELDISKGTILITATGYSQGTLAYDSKNGFSIADGNEISWGDDNPDHDITITGKSVKNNIIIAGGNTNVTLKNLEIGLLSNLISNETPAIVLLCGTEENKNTATFTLEGNNKLTGKSYSPAVQINKFAELTIEGDGLLEAVGEINCAGIGASRYNNAYNYCVSVGKQDSTCRAGGVLIINSGRVISAASGGEAGLGTSLLNTQTNFGSIVINGGEVIAKNNNNTKGIRADKVEINGGLVHAEPHTGGTRGIYAETCFEMNGGTLAMGTLTAGEKGITAGSDSTTFSITGGNINSYFDGEITGRKLTKLYFVSEDGTPLADTEVTVTEGNGQDAKTWTAVTDAKGVITTYFAEDTTSVTVSYGDEEAVKVDLGNGQALIGGECSCKAEAILWEAGLPDAVTLYGDDAREYAVAAAKIQAEKPCNMPIHPNLQEITYSLSVKDRDNNDVTDTSSYASLADGKLTLKPVDAPYTVTLTAKVGNIEKTVTVEVKKGDAEAEVTSIDLSKGDVTISKDGESYKYTQGDATVDAAGGNFLLTGNANDAKVTVNASDVNFTLSQDAKSNVWSILAGEGAENISVNGENVKGKVRFGNDGDAQALLGYVSADKVKLNPDSGDIALGEDSVTQGAFTVTDLAEKELAVFGADTEAERTVTNNGDDSLTLNINGEEVTLADGKFFTIEKALEMKTDAAKTCYTYRMNGDAGKYYLIVTGEGDAAAETRFDDGIRQNINEVIFDDDLDGTLRADGFLYNVNLTELHAENFSDIVVYTGGLGKVYLGENISKLTWGNYCNTNYISVPEENPYFVSDEKGVLYTKDYSTLVILPSRLKGEYTVNENCTHINANATMNCSLDMLTLGKNVEYIGGTYVFFNNQMGGFSVEAGNKYFAAKDGILYTADMTKMVAYPGKRANTTLEIPETVNYVESLILAGRPIKTLIIPEGVNITNNGGLQRLTNLEEIQLLGSYAGTFDQATNLKKLTVSDNFDFTKQDFRNTSMYWILDKSKRPETGAGITVTGGDAVYDGNQHGVTVAVGNKDINEDRYTIEYSEDGETYQAEPFAYTEPGTYTVYWRIKMGPTDLYDFSTELYSQHTFTISALEAEENWFNLESVKPDNADEDWTPVTLDQPKAAASLEGGYTVKYGDNDSVPTEPGNYLVTVEITKDGYKKETLTLGYYKVLPSDSTDVVLSFVTNGGTTIEPITGAENSDVTKPENPTRNGYTFAGWYSDASLRTEAEIPENMPNENAAYYAKWTRTKYTITYDMGVDVTDAVNGNNPETYNVETPDFTLETPTRPGYAFTGWTWDGQSEPQAEVTIEKGSFGDKNFTANWEQITYKVTYPNAYDVVSGNVESYTIDDIANDITLTSPADREGYTFTGWSMKVNGIVYIIPAEGAIPAGTLGDIELTGIWLAENQTLTLKANGGEFADGSETMTISADYESSMPALTQPTRKGYTFAGWYTDEACNNAFNAATMPLSTTIYAKWTKNAGSGSVTIVQKPTIEADENAVVTLGADGTTASITVKDGYELEDVTVNGVSKGKVTLLYGLKTGDKVVVTTQKKADDNQALIEAVKNTKLVARSVNAKAPSGKKAIKVYWYEKEGSKLSFDGYEIYRSTKKNSGYGTKPIFKTKKSLQYFNTSAKKGTRYYYKVRGYKMIDGKKVYTPYSLKAIRTAK